MGLRFECGKHSNDGFKITDSETGEDLTEKILLTKVDILVSVRPNQTNTVRLEMYADGLDVVCDHAKVKVVNPDETRGDLPWRDFDTEELKDEISELRRQVRGLSDTLDLLLKKTVETELITKAVRTRLVAMQAEVAESNNDI